MSERKPHDYLRYAVGELVLVVFGILIVLQINNWNEERIEQRQITEYAHDLITDLEPHEAYSHTDHSLLTDDMKDIKAMLNFISFSEIHQV